MGDIIRFNGGDAPPKPVSDMLDAIPRDMRTAVVVGYTAEGHFYFGSSNPDGAEVMWLLEVAKKRVLELCE